MKKQAVMKFNTLVENITSTHEHFQNQAFKAINRSLTLRNWIIGWYIVEFEQRGEKRAKYGSKLLSHLASQFKSIKGLDERSLRNFRTLFICYPQFFKIIQDETEKIGSAPFLSHLVQQKDTMAIRETVSAELGIAGSIMDANQLIHHLSYSHLETLCSLEDLYKRTFYELQCIQGTWSVRTLRRQIHSLYYERMGMSRKPNLLKEITNAKISTETTENVIKSVYAFEFLNLNAQDAVEENQLVAALLDHIQNFLLEMGHGFCLEARQKKILIGDEYFFIDLVFYHRILKCHVLVEVKMGKFEHFQTAQLNTYLNYYKQMVKQENDQPPVGILLVTDKNHALVEYATAGMDNQLFVSKYLIELPQKEELKTFIEKELQAWMERG
jgi:predicted nuclease of restriction endonuclease-like (RecB) superfamily